jgi:hypothetical protein
VSEKTDSELALWKDPDMLALAKELFKYAAIAAIGAYLLFKVIMPLIRTMMTPPPKPAGVTLGGNVNIVSDDENESPRRPSRSSRSSATRAIWRSRTRKS